MTIRTCSAALILALSCSSLGAAPAAGSLATLARAYRESPSPARRSALTTYLAGHPKDAALVNLALGITAYEQKNYAAAIAALKPLQGKLAPIADYSAYYLAAARVESNDLDVTSADLAATHRNSPLNGKSWLLEARARKASSPLDAVRLLRERYAELPQPEGDVTLADCYQAANDLPHAAEFYQRVYYNYLSGAAASRAAAALITLKDAMGAGYPSPGAAQLLHRADRLMEAAEYAQAKKEYEGVAAQAGGVEHDQALVRMGAADYLAGKTAPAWTYLRGLEVADSEAAAERLYYLAECARRRDDDREMMSAVQQLDGALQAVAVAAQGADVGGQPLSPVEPAGKLRAAPPDHLPGFSRRAAGRAESLEGHVPSLPARSGRRVPPAARAPAAVPGTLHGGRGALFPGAAPGAHGRCGRGARLLSEAGHCVRESLLCDAGARTPEDSSPPPVRHPPRLRSSLPQSASPRPRRWLRRPRRPRKRASSARACCGRPG